MALDADQVAAFLRQHPEFFETHAPLLTEIELPHPHGGRTVSISERQILTLREKSKLLEGKLSELIQFGEDNDAIGEKVHRLALALIGTRGLDSVFDAIYASLEDDFAVPHVALRIWVRAAADSHFNAAAIAQYRERHTEFTEVAVELKDFVANMTAPVCGQHAVYETQNWFGEQATHLRSFACVPLDLRAAGGHGLLMLASEDARRFYPEMGSVFLTRIGQLADAAIDAALDRTD